MPRYRFGRIQCARESQAAAMLVLARYPFVAGMREDGDGVAYTLDLAMLPTGDGPAADLMVRREVERAVTLHTTRSE